MILYASALFLALSFFIIFHVICYHFCFKVKSESIFQLLIIKAERFRTVCLDFLDLSVKRQPSLPINDNSLEPVFQHTAITTL